MAYKMDVLQKLKKLRVLVLVLVVLFVLSGLITNVIQACTLPLKLISKRLYRKINVVIVYWYWSLLPFSIESWAGYDIRIFAEPNQFKQGPNTEHAIVLLNHRGDVDWMVGWVFIERAGMLGGTKAYMKDVAKYLPGIGWSFILMEYPILSRDWGRDQERLRGYCNNLKDYPVNMLLCLFAEGSRFTEEKHAASMEYCKANGLPVLKHHLFPRTKGFALLAKHMKGVVYDLTFGFREGQPSLSGIINAEPCSVDMLLRRFALSDIPTDSEEDTKQWLIKLYQEKDEIYEYYLKHKTFPPKYGVEVDIPQRPWARVVVAIWCLVLGVPIAALIVSLYLSSAWWTLLLMAFIFFLAERLFSVFIGMTTSRSGHGLTPKKD